MKITAMKRNCSGLFRRALPAGLAGLLAFVATGLRGGEFLIDFNAPAPGLFKEFGNGAADYRLDGGASALGGDGYLALTDAGRDQISLVVFTNLQPSVVVGALTLEADVRIGGGTGRPAAGFSISLVGPEDRLLTGDPWPTILDCDGCGPPPAFAANNIPEEGSRTGLAIDVEDVLMGL